MSKILVVGHGGASAEIVRAIAKTKEMENVIVVTAEEAKDVFTPEPNPIIMPYDLRVLSIPPVLRETKNYINGKKLPKRKKP